MPESEDFFSTSMLIVLIVILIVSQSPTYRHGIVQVNGEVTHEETE